MPGAKGLFILLIVAGALLFPRVALSPGGGVVCITADDGGRQACQNILELAAKYRLKVTLGIIVQPVEENNPNFVTWDMLKAGLEQGLLQVASHTMTHPHLPSISAADLDRELQQSKMILEERLGVAVDTLFYPYGEYDHSVLNITQKYYRFGRRASLKTRRFNTPPLKFYELEARSIKKGYVPEELKNWIMDAMHRGKLLILVFHGIVDGQPTNEYDYDVADFEAIMSFMSASGIPTLTIAEAVQPYIAPAIE